MILTNKYCIYIKMSRFSEKSRFKESKWADGGHSLNRYFTVQYSELQYINTVQ